jgi:hypothetical protein
MFSDYRKQMFGQLIEMLIVIRAGLRNKKLFLVIKIDVLP